MSFYNLSNVTTESGINLNVPKIVLRGDSFGQISIWNVPEIDICNLGSDKVASFEPNSTFSLSNAWKDIKSSPCGIIDHLV